ncbi:malate dehydrogenase, NAD-dependent [Syntrophotalea carbinolica DSM 2380]|uniref:Malate dehydrogenase n=1 Tax=Syntrophotalea carbinolica (strain DSM 2380 / NBRC 103641 / GraBd1) TaxID=338963 RepID=MDH_SYNC1|nr:malate dehydrogenase [Syntrophotalea carbinolica]Q3A5S0.1 RecName: Full=Malate dehydrogenase [Syntrophotalea carbinolica DSM 2380]ABA88287.1 malate dehydrogenase, NAD-dependent [Syntrophotalea carbinolica DSM 2380]
MVKPKIALIGGGQIGNSIAHLAAMRELGNVIMFDIKDGLAQGKCLDIAQAAPISNFDVQLCGSNDISCIAGADIVVVTAGIPRKPGMTREDLIEINARIMVTVAEGIKTHAPESIVIVLSNPLDAMVTLCQKITGFPTQRIMGMAGVLDSARFASFIAWELGVSVRDVNAMVLGGHGDAMVPIVRFANVNGIPALELLKNKYGDEDKARQVMAGLVERTQDAGGEVVHLLQTGSAFISPATSAIAMVEAVIHDQKRLLPVCAMLDGQFGISGYYVGVPCILGVGGVERIVEFELTEDEQALLDHSVGEVKKLVDSLPL